MKLKLVSFFLFPLIIFFGLFSVKSAFADTFQLSGNVKDSGGNPISGVSIDVFNAGTTTIVVNSSTDSSGNYTVNISSGSYDIKVTPPTNSNFTSATYLNKSITSNTVVNFVLVPAGTVRLSGHIYDQSGNPVPNIQVYMPPGGNSAGIFVSTSTDSSGAYSLTASPGNYEVIISGNGGSQNLPEVYGIAVNNYPLSQSIIVDITLPAKQVIVHVQDSSQNPVSGALVNVGGSGNISFGGATARAGGGYGSIPNLGVSDGSPAVTDSAGNATLWLFPGNYSSLVNPPNGSNATSSTASFSVSGNTQTTITLPTPVTLSGHVYNQNHAPVPGLSIYMPPGGNSSGVFISGGTDASGAYSLSALPGSYEIVVSGSNIDPSLNLPQIFSIIVDNYSLTKNTNLDITLPAKQITVHVQDAAQNAVSGINITASGGSGGLTFGQNFTATRGGSGYNSPVITDSLGNATLWLFPSSYSFTATPPGGSNFTTTTTSTSIVNTNQVTITMKQPVTLSGHVYNQDGVPLANQRVITPRGGNAYDITTTATTDSNGFYSLSVLAGTYEVVIDSNGNTDPSLHLPQVYSFIIDNYSLLQNQTLNFSLPGKQVVIHVQDQGQNPVSGVAINIGGAAQSISLGNNVSTTRGGGGYGNIPNLGLSAGPAAITDALGNVSLWLFPGNYSVLANPQSGGIYSPFSLSGLSITGTQTEVISLQFVHAAPVTTAILTTRLSDETYSDPTTVSLSAIASSGFTVANTYYTIDGGAKQTYTTPFTVSGSGSHKITYWSIDNLGVFETPNTKAFSIDDPPKISSIAGSTINEGSTYTATGSFTDADSSSWTGTVDYGDGQGIQPLTINPDKTFTLSHQYLDNKPNNAPYTVIVNITDNQGAGSTATTSVVVLNVAPSVGSITVQSNPVILGSPFSVNSVTFSDPGVLDTHTAIWNWGDGTTSPGTVVETNGSGYISATDHVYSAVGTYQITLTVTDNDGALGTSVFQYAVVYQPSRSGLFSGHSIFTSPKGADLQNLNATGNVHFAVDVKYANNSNIPTGKVSMDFSNGKISLTAASFNYLVINGIQAILAGSGSVNGVPGYSFLASGIDGTQTGIGYIRFQIIDPVGNVIYDTQPGAAVNAAPTTPVTGGMVVVHN